MTQNLHTNYTFSFLSFSVLFNKNHGCSSKTPPMQYVIFGPIDQYTEIQINKFILIKID